LQTLKNSDELADEAKPPRAQRKQSQRPRSAAQLASLLSVARTSSRCQSMDHRQLTPLRDLEQRRAALPLLQPWRLDLVSRALLDVACPSA
jgi:hypothetical protein